MLSKIEARVKYKNLRKHLTESEILYMSVDIANNLLKLNIWELKTFHLFMTKDENKEVDTKPIFDILIGKEKEIIIPKININRNSLDSYIFDEKTVFSLDKLMIPEPVNGILFNGKIDVVILPLLAYDLDGNRIGYGKGFYDKFISNLKSEPLKIGVSYFSPEKSLEFNNHDINLDYCITPNKIFSFSEKSYY
ncbi:MAG: 5-formyltetrahydrofolate cyclo-ligase [Flavobacteriaceae bacterium]|nr:5-formyltetrahydrofolate cyclo-ligase [Flavobacteriaceae bacterium]|tara:strand:- start:1991 stop:2569 length:579 start_codon:yes stop_codon:yes gene_type:complete